MLFRSGFYLDTETYLRGLAQNHPLIMHNQPVSNTDATLRYSFFRINNLEELNAATRTLIHDTCMVWVSFDGKDLNKGGSIKQLNRTMLLFLNILTLDPADLNKATAISKCFDTSYSVMQDIKKSIYDAAQEDPCESPFKNIYPARWEQDGPIGDNLYGWILEFEYITKAFT